ncbi:hypothetical protein T484DRAFT_1854048 [Baffinella frigidus]|nr:hypothetical protein T484DRAFT_1854048 [Cryptophyta sp. CCMP2293]
MSTGNRYCGLSSYPDDLPSYYQYFNDPTKALYQYFTDPSNGGSKALMDYCPVMSKYSNKHCNNDTGLQP